MKNYILLLVVLITTFSFSANAQLLDKIRKKAEEKIEKGIDKILTKKEKEKEKEKESKPKKEKDSKKGEGKGTEITSKKEANQRAEVWRNFKFVPGEKVIFYDDLKGEEIGEFPSRWDLNEGGAEVATLNNEKFIMPTTGHENTIFPLFNTKNYVSDEFTVEFDIYVDELSFDKHSGSEVNYNIFLTEKYLQSDSRSIAEVEFNLSQDKTSGYVTKYDFQLEQVSIEPLNAWHHISISYYKGKFKFYFDEKRIANIPNLSIIPDLFAIQIESRADDKHPKGKVNCGIKNIRIAHGGGQMYKRIIADGKYSTNGILFDIGKTTIQKQSYGIINKFVNILNENKDWKFQIIGHTDSDGDDASNLKLSEQRAEAVKKAIVDFGIKPDRLTILGKGESEPLNKNTSIEEKANNRRVEFIKQ